MAFALSVPQVLLTDIVSVDVIGCIYGLVSGLALVYSGETLR